MRAQIATLPARPDAPNEDFAAVSSSSAVLLDGAGAPDGLQSGCSHGVAWYARVLGACLLASISTTDPAPLRDCLAEAISCVRSLHETTCDLSHEGTPSATVLAVRIRRGQLEYLVLADSVLIVANSEAPPLVVSDDRERQAGRHYRAAIDAAPLGTQAHDQSLREYLATLRRHRNRPGGFWVAAAEPSAAAQSLTGQVPLSEIQAFLLLSDGASRLVDRFGTATWPEVLKVIDDDGPAELLRRTREAEDSDPDGKRWPRGKAHDDATVVYCRDLA